MVDEAPANTDQSEDSEGSEGENQSAPKEKPEMMFEPSIIRNNGNKQEQVPLWLITFTDVMALMLTFFVLLYSMSVPQQEKWDEITEALTSKFNQQFSRPYNAGSQDVIEIDKINPSRALDLNYLKTLVRNLLRSKNIEDVIIFQNGDRLVISLPAELLFESAQAEVKLEGKKVLFALGGALSRVKNRIEIAGHTDPAPLSPNNRTGYSSNWELSLARSAAVAAMLKDVGYSRSVAIRGLSSGRYDEMPEDEPEEKRYALSRRVDLIIMEDDGSRRKFYGAQ